MQGQKNEAVAVVTVATAAQFRTEINRDDIAAATALITAPIAQEAASYSLSDLQFRIVRH